MIADSLNRYFMPERWMRAVGGPKYVQLSQYVLSLIENGTLPPNTQLPPEREMASIASVSRVTIRQAIEELVKRDVLEQRRGIGTFVKPQPIRHVQNADALISFTEYMSQHGHTPVTQVLSAGIFTPTPSEMVSLSLGSKDKVSRLKRLRSINTVPMALEHASLPTDILPDPDCLGASLYDVLRQQNTAPVRATQRIRAYNLNKSEANLLNMRVDAAVLRITRHSFLASGRAVELTVGVYRSDLYEITSDLSI